jgi:MFS family permease
MFVAPVAGRMSDRIGGKYILIAGLTLFGLGMGLIALIAQTDSAWYDFLAPQVAAGIGIGCTFAPMITMAMRYIDPMMAGAASGLFNTTRQVGTVIGTAGVGALLQNRIVAGFTSQAALRTASLPAPARLKIITEFRQAARSGVQVGSGRSTRGLAGQIFTHGFVQGMRPTMAVPILILLIGAASCLAIRQRARPPEQAAPAGIAETSGSATS